MRWPKPTNNEGSIPPALACILIYTPKLIVARPRKQLPAVYENTICDLALMGCSAREIYRKLDKQVSLRTIHRRVAEIAPHPGDAWTLAGPDWDKAELIPSMLTEVIERSGGRVRTISRDLAKWTVRVWRAALTLPLWEVYELAVEYRRAAEGAKGALPRQGCSGSG